MSRNVRNDGIWRRDGVEHLALGQHEIDVWRIFFTHEKRAIGVQYQALWIRRQVVRRDEWVLNGRSMMRFYKR
jgi:hypothetical protein